MCLWYDEAIPVQVSQQPSHTLTININILDILYYMHIWFIYVEILVQVSDTHISGLA